MQTITDNQLNNYAELAVGLVFLLYPDHLETIKPDKGTLRVSAHCLNAYLPEDKEILPCQQVFLDQEERFYSIHGRKVQYHACTCWMIELAPIESTDAVASMNRIAAARKILLDMSNQINQLDSDKDIYDFILDNCGKAVEHSSLCSLMLVKGDHTRIVAKRGYGDYVCGIEFVLANTFIGRQTNGKCDRIIVINDLDIYHKRYHEEIRTEQEAQLIQSTLSAPIIVNGKLYAILCFDSLKKDAFTRHDEELLDIIKSSIEIIIENYQMHMQIKHLSEHDILTGLYNRAYLRNYAQCHETDRYYAGMFDMNDLKGINDGHGHGNGDRIICTFADALVNAFPASCKFSRIGGDEFACILYDVDLDGIQSRIAALREQFLDTPISLSDGAVTTLSFSCGFAPHEPYTELTDAIQAADMNMYEEKRHFKAMHL